MIILLTTRRHAYTLDTFYAIHRTALRGRIRVRSYDWLFRRPRLKPATYIFGDIERLLPHELERAELFWRLVKGAGPSFRALNRPIQCLKRYELLRHLHERGYNDFDAYRLNEGRWPRRYPVFLRQEREHTGNESELLRDREALQAGINAMAARGLTRDDRLAIEYCAEPRVDGIFMKYGTYIVGNRIVPRHLLFSRDWVVKGSTYVTEATVEEERLFVEKNPHAGYLRKIAKIGGYEFGRFDYGLVNGRIQIYEFNTNPTISVPSMVSNPIRARITPLRDAPLVEAILDLDDSVPVARSVFVPYEANRLFYRRIAPKRQLAKLRRRNAS